MDNGKTKDAHYSKRVEIATKAYNCGCFIFSAKSQKLYTPREFVTSGEEVNFNKMGLEKYADQILMYPKSAIALYRERVDKAKTKLSEVERDLQDVTEKLLLNFELKPIQKK